MCNKEQSKEEPSFLCLVVLVLDCMFAPLKNIKHMEMIDAN